MDAAAVAEMQRQMAAMQATITALQAAQAAAGPAPAAAAINIDASALVTALNSVRPPKDHSKDLDHVDIFTAEGSIRTDDFLKNVEGTFFLKNTPYADKVRLVVPRLDSKALCTFKAFKNAAGYTNDSNTSMWAEFRQLMLGLLLDLRVERDNLKAEYAKLSQTGSAEKYVEKYCDLVSRIRLNPEAAKLHTDDLFILRFVGKLKTTVQAFLTNCTFTSLEEAYGAAIAQDKLVFKADTESSAPKAPFSTPTWSLLGTPQPQPQIMALLQLAAMNYDWDCVQMQPTVKFPPSGPSSSQAPKTPSLNSVEHDHSVGPNDPIPEMMPEIQEWCIKHNTCFRCRTKNTKHSSSKCPQFKGVPYSKNYHPRVNFVGEASDGKSSSQQGNG
eukprot:455180-Rhodomonas_salina.1